MAGASVLIDQPGLYPDLSEVDYHLDPVAGGSLSTSGAKALLPPSCPAIYNYHRSHPRPPKAEFDFGHAAHRLVLGVGAPIRCIEAENWRKNATKQAADEATADGATPLLRADYDRVHAMAEALRGHPIAADLFAPDSGRAEQTIVWVDDATGVWCRARIDWLRHPTTGHRFIVPDYKTAASADLDSLSKATANFAYYMQADAYLDAVKSIGYGGPDARFLFVYQEKSGPFVVTVVELDSSALRIGKAKNKRAREVYARCTATGHWPTYCEGVETISLPRWAEIQEGEHLA